MQPTTNQTVPANTPAPSQTPERQPSTGASAPLPISGDLLHHIGGAGPTGTW